MLKQTEAYLAALAQLTDALTLQEPADVIDGLEHHHHDVRDGHACVDLLRVLWERHPDFARAMDQVWKEREQRWQAEMAAWRAENKDDMIPFD
jgi:hypothetical protein